MKLCVGLENHIVRNMLCLNLFELLTSWKNSLDRGGFVGSSLSLSVCLSVCLTVCLSV